MIECYYKKQLTYYFIRSNVNGQMLIVLQRAVAQLASAHGLGPWGRGFESHQPE